MLVRNRQHRLCDPPWNNEIGHQSPRRIQTVKRYVLCLGAPEFFEEVHRVRAQVSQRTVM